MGIKCNPRTVTDGLVLALDAGNTKSYPGSGITWTDLIGRGNTGTLTNDPTYNNTSGGSIVFDGTNVNVSIGTNGFSFGNSPGTLSAWAKTRDRESTGTIVSYGNAASNGARFLGVGQSNFYFSGYGSSISASGLSYTWFNLVGVYNGTQASMYVNGVLVAGPTLQSWNTVASNAGIGKNVNNSEYWNGDVAQVQIYNRALSAAEIQQNYNSFKGRYANYITESLYSFTTATFSPGGVTGRDGPTLAQAKSGLTGTGVDAWKNNTAFFNVTTGIQYWTVPQTGTYSIECFGAQGAYGLTDAGGTGNASGGRGSRMKGNFTLTMGDKYSIVVGQQGITQNSSGWGGGGGGGGTFVWKTSSTTQPIIVSGGGGCGGKSSIGQQNGQTSTSGGNGSNNGGTGGTNGLASQSLSICGGGGGRGWLGGPSYNCGGAFTYSATYIDATGHATGQLGDGGFGGGGGSYGGGGGGGGYSGGGSAGWSHSGFGGGGGSYNTGTSQSNTAGERSGDGQVIITLL